MHISRSGTISAIFALLFLTLYLFSGCAMPEIQSTWRDREIIINGKDEDTEWEGAKYFFNDKNVTLGILNDRDYLYLRLSTRDRAVQQNLMVRGFTLWFDPSGGQNKSFGIQFPIGIWMDMASIGSRLEPGQKPDTSQLKKILDESLNMFEIIGPEDKELNSQLVAHAGELGIRLHLDVVKDNMVYELRMPLMRTETEPFGICTERTEAIAIGLVNSNIEAEQLNNRLNRFEGDGMVGRRISMSDNASGTVVNDDRDILQQELPGGARGGRVGMPSSGKSLEDIDFWLKVLLAQE